METQLYKMYGMKQKRVLRGKFILIQAINSQIKILTYQLKELEK